MRTLSRKTKSTKKQFKALQPVSLKGLIAATVKLWRIHHLTNDQARYVPILAELAQELQTHLGERETGYLFETNRHLPYSPRRIQQIVKATAERAKITKRVYPHLLRHSVATTLLETTQIYAESNTEMLKESYRRALTE
jgi:integrase/recombinase XerD